MFRDYLLCLMLLCLLSVAMIGHAQAEENHLVIGKVTDRKNNPVEGAKVILYNGVSECMNETRTDKSGNFEFSLVDHKKTSTCKVIIEYEANGTQYRTPWNQVRWYPLGPVVSILEEDTRLYDYPEPEYGYIWGMVTTSSKYGGYLDATVYIMNADDDKKYYTYTKAFCDGRYIFNVPKGTYYVYAQSMYDGVIYESKNMQTVAVQGCTDLTKVQPVELVLPLINPKPYPDPFIIPEPGENIVSGIVTSKDGKPYTDAVVSLWQRTDDGRSFMKLDAFREKPDDSGHYEFKGVSTYADYPPGVNEIVCKKDLKIVVEYRDSNGNPHEISEVRPIYYPDVLLPDGGEKQARNITVDFTIDEVTGQASVNTHTPAGPSGTGSGSIPQIAIVVVCLIMLASAVVLLLFKRK